MTDDTEQTDSAVTEAKIAARFARLRAAEAECAPAVTAASLANAGTGVSSAIWPARYSLPRVAAGLGLLALAFTLLNQQPGEDPAALYVSIMNKQYMQTDSLLEVSAGVLPARTGLPGLYEPDVGSDPEKYTK